MNQDEPRVSIGLPVFNGENYLVEALDSLLTQTYEDFELIISDNASTDRTPEICQEYIEKDNRVRYCRNKTNLGGAYNDNRVVELSTGEYFKWAAHDDICAPEFLERCVEVLESEPAVVLSYPKTTLVDEHGNFIERCFDGFNLRFPQPHQRFRFILKGYRLLNPIYGVMRTNALRRTRLIKTYADSDRVLLGELALQGEFCEVPEYLFYRRIHPKKSTISNASVEEMAAWYDPGTQGKILIPKTKRFLGFLTSISRARLSRSDRVRCYIEFATFYLTPKSWGWRLEGLRQDINQAIRVLPHSFLI
jgi:glycosyltransferase involved in cell wall biosynthesis